jgi:hypothetical protein
MLAQVTMLFSSSRRTVCTPCLPFLRKIKVFQQIKSGANGEISIFLKNGKQGVQTVRLDELNNIVTWANVTFIFKN